MKSDQIANLVFFVTTVVAGLACLWMHHDVIGTSLLTGAAYHAAPSPFVRTTWGKPAAEAQPPADDAAGGEQ